MKLKTARVTNFRSVEDSGEFTLDQVSCLVGKNEAGKTAIVQALAGLNPHPSTPITFEKERDYPRRFYTDYATRHDGKEAVVVTTTWTLDETERKALIQVVGDGAITGDEVTISRSYGATEPDWTFPISWRKGVEYLVQDERLDAIEKGPLASAIDTASLRAELKSIASPTPKHMRLLQRIDAFSGSTMSGQIKTQLSTSLPRFMYFSHYDRMDGQIRLDTYKARKAGQQPGVLIGEQVFVDFLEYAGTSVDEITSATTFEGLNARCEAASNSITAQLLDYWTQNPDLEIVVAVTKAESQDAAPFNQGVIARARVRNNLHKMSVPFSERSAGFIWFFSFLVKFAQVQKGGGSLVLLLDEPGLTLHGKAQADLLRYFEEKLAPKHQVIFTTHSPFMVPANDLPSVRVVEDLVLSPKPGQRVPNGTKVRSDALATDRDTLFPLQGALGYELTQSLFIGKHTLLVEGPSDILYLQACSNALKKRGKRGLDPRWTICPAGGIDKIQPFVALFAGARLDIAALTDYAKADKKKLDSLKQNKVLEGGKLLTFASVLGIEEGDVEDIFSPALYATVLNEAFALSADHKVTAESLEAADLTTGRLVKKAEAYFRVLPAETQEFDHFTPSAWLFQNLGVLDSGGQSVTETLERSETVISALNKLLPER